MELQELAESTSHANLVEGLNVSVITKRCKYFHYCCDGTDDRGWGCGYRTLQTLCHCCCPDKVPSLSDIQKTLVTVGDKPISFQNSKQWIGCVEAFIVLDELYNVSCKLIHVASGTDVAKHIPELHEHFLTNGSPVMIGGNIDASSKTLVGIASNNDDFHKSFVLIADPHYTATGDEDISGYVKWHRLDVFVSNSFYNFCLPLVHD